MGGTFPATDRLQDSDFYKKTVKSILRCTFVCDFSPPRTQTLTPQSL